MINWCPRCMTLWPISRSEGEELDGNLYYVRYPLIGGKGAVVVATTRPETMLGDTAVAVHPEDPRYKAFIGQKVLLPLVERPLPVIADPYVDREFGTGALKITPAHDFNDFEVGRKHALDLLQVITEDGTMGQAAGAYAGLDRYTCRKRLVKDLEKGGYLVIGGELTTIVSATVTAARVPVEPMSPFSGLWPPFAGGPGHRAVTRRENPNLSAKWKRTTSSRLENLEDWCISRQIWWGTGFPPGIVSSAVRSWSSRMSRRPATFAAATICSRIRMCSTPGSVPPSGRFQPWGWPRIP